MIQSGTILNTCDKSGVVLVQCIKVLGGSKKRIAYLNDIIVVSVKHVNPRRLSRLKEHRRKRFFKGTLHRAIIVRTKSNFCRMPGIFIRFNINSVVLVNKKNIPISTRTFGPILRESCMRFPTLGCISRGII